MLARFVKIFTVIVVCYATLSTAQSSQKEFLVVLLHGMNKDGGHMEEKVSDLLQVCREKSPHFDADKLEIWCPTAPTDTKTWFDSPLHARLKSFTDIPWGSLGKLGWEYLNYKRGNDLFSHLENSQSSIDWLKEEIAHKLESHGLGYDRLIIAGHSMGGVTALALGMQMPEPVEAIICMMGLWIPTTVHTTPKNILFVRGEKDGIISPWASDLTKSDLLSYESAHTSIEVKDLPNTFHGISKESTTAVGTFLYNKVFKESVLYPQ